MKIYRVVKEKFVKDLSGEGARLYGGRWNKKGDAMLYFSEHLSLCVLEILVHTEQQLLTNDFWFLEIEIPDDKIKNTNLKAIPKQWRINPPNSMTKAYGSEWLASKKSLALRVPSAILPTEGNILVNPNHKDFGQVKIIKTRVLDLDSRVKSNKLN